jgi:silicon transporter
MSDSSSQGKGPLDMIKYVVSTLALILSIILIMGLIFNEQTTLSRDVHPAMAFVVGWVAIIWLTMVEGSQGSFVGLAPIHVSLYEKSHPVAAICGRLVHKGDNLDRYLLGRQFMVVVVVFSVNISCGPIADAELWGLPETFKNIFLGSGLAMILFTCMVGQLNSQVNASLRMLDYCNNYFAVFTLYVAMAIEFSGLLHSSYLIQMIVAAMAGQKIESNEPPRDGAQELFFWARGLMSTALLIFAFAVTLAALFDGKTTMWDGVPGGLAVVVFFILMSVVGMLEGMQIAFFAVAKLQEKDRGDHVFAKRTCHLLFKNQGRNLAGFMIGRQLTVVSCMFFIARVTSLDVDVDAGEETLWGVSDGAQKFFNTGLLGAYITTIVASIAWQLVASAFPIAFLSNPFTYIFLRICLFFEATGICSGAWVLAAIHAKIAGFQRDEVYIGTADERAAGKKPDEEAHMHFGTNIIPLPTSDEDAKALASKFGPAMFLSGRREQVLANIKDLRSLISSATSEDEKEAYQTALKMEIAALKRVNESEREVEASRHMQQEHDLEMQASAPQQQQPVASRAVPAAGEIADITSNMSADGTDSVISA